jgi:hypothetical protein
LVLITTMKGVPICQVILGENMVMYAKKIVTHVVTITFMA